MDEKKKNLLLCFITACVCICIIFVCKSVLHITLIDGDSMYPALKNGQFVRYKTDTAGMVRGDIVLFKESGIRTLVKRIIAVPGDSLTVIDDKLYINETKYDFNTSVENFGILKQGTLMLGENEFFCIGDNVNESYDSRFLGPIGREKIFGVVLTGN